MADLDFNPTTQKFDLVSDTASDIAVVDTAGLFTGTNVETVLAELGNSIIGQDTLAEILAIGNTSGGTNLIMSAGDILTADTINETTSTSGVTVDGLLLKDGDVDLNGAGKIIFDADADTHLNSTSDDTLTLTLGGATAMQWVALGTTINIAAGYTLAVDTIIETTGSAGVTIDSVLLKDGQVDLDDSKALILGTGDDYSLQYDGTNALYNSTVVGSGEHQFTGNIQVDNNASAITSGNYAVNINSGTTGAGTPPSSGDANLVAQWRMDTGSGTTAFDETANNHDGTFSGTPTWVGSGAFGYTGDDSIDFDGTEAIDVSNDVAFRMERTDTWSITAWVQFDTASNNAVLGKMDATSGFRGFRFYKNSGEDMTCQLISTTAGGNTIEVIGTSQVTLTDGEWYFIGMSYDGSSTAAGFNFYENDKKLSKVTNVDNLSATTISTVNLELASSGNAGIDLNGRLDTVSFYSDVRTDAEMLADYTNGIPVGVGTIIDTETALTGTSKITSFRVATVEKAFIDIAGEGNFVGADIQGASLILDADGDTSITADTDDQIDIEIAGADDFQFTANTFTALSGSTIATNTIVETTGAAGVTIDGVVLKDTTIDVNGTADAIILDADGDTTISAPTANQIDIEIAGADDFQFTANTFTALAGSSITLADGAINIGGDLNHDGTNVGFYGTAPAAQSAAYTLNATAVLDRTLLASASATTLNNNNALAALITDLQAIGLIG